MLLAVKTSHLQNVLEFNFFVLLFLGASSFLAVAQDDVQLYEEGRKIIQAEGPEAAIAYFEKVAMGKGSMHALFGLGWAWWEDGNIEESEVVTTFVLTRAKGKNLKANCNFLLGYIYSQKGELPKAELHMGKARDIYEEMGKLDNLSKALCGLASIQIKSQNFLEAEMTLAKADDVYQQFKKEDDLKGPKKPTQGYYYELLSRVSFGLGHYSQALENSKLSYKHYVEAGDEARAIQTLSAVGYYKILNGQIEEGLEDTKRVDEAIYATESEFKRLSYYNAINWIIAYRCSGHDYSEIERSVREGIENNNDLHLMKQLKFALVWNCGK